MTDATYPKTGEYGTQEEQTAGTKRLRCEHLQNGQAADLGGVTTDRVYSRDYSKRDPDGDQHDDTLTPFLGNPLRW